MSSSPPTTPPESSSVGVGAKKDARARADFPVALAPPFAFLLPAPVATGAAGGAGVVEEALPPSSFSPFSSSAPTFPAEIFAFFRLTRVFLFFFFNLCALLFFGRLLTPAGADAFMFSFILVSICGPARFTVVVGRGEVFCVSLWLVAGRIPPPEPPNYFTSKRQQCTPSQI